MTETHLHLSNFIDPEKELVKLYHLSSSPARMGVINNLRPLGC